MPRPRPTTRHCDTARSTIESISRARGATIRKYGTTDINASIVASGPVSSGTQVFNSRARSGEGIDVKCGGKACFAMELWASHSVSS